jgi:heat shock protein HtpX
MAFKAVGLQTQIWNNNIRSTLLLAGFPVLLALMIWGFFYLMLFFDGGQHMMAATASGKYYAYQGRGAMPDYGLPWRDALRQSFYMTLRHGYWAVLAAGAWFVIAWLFHASMIRAASGARKLSRQEMPQLYNMLENLCISRGLPMPSLQIIESPALNAFASGIDEKSYSVTVTRGLLQTLPPDELEAVLGHELTHIVNKDVRLMVVAAIFVGMLAFVSEMLFRALRLMSYAPRRSSRGKGGGGIVIAMLAAMAVVAVGWFLSILIRFALSRRREYLADAGAVELTKNPDAMMRALMRISGHSRVENMTANIRDMCIDNDRGFMGLFSTHPPIERRIAMIAEGTGSRVPELTDARPFIPPPSAPSTPPSRPAQAASSSVPAAGAEDYWETDR